MWILFSIVCLFVNDVNSEQQQKPCLFLLLLIKLEYLLEEWREKQILFDRSQRQLIIINNSSKKKWCSNDRKTCGRPTMNVIAPLDFHIFFLEIRTAESVSLPFHLIVYRFHMRWFVVAGLTSVHIIIIKGLSE